MTKRALYIRRRRLLATARFLAAYFALGIGWKAWRSGVTDWLPGWDSIVPRSIAGAILYLVLRPVTDAAR